MVQEVICNIKHKWFLILACMFVVSILLMGEKILFNQYTVQTGNIHIETVVKVSRENEGSNAEYKDRIMYDKFFNTYSFMNSFIDDTANKIDYTKLNAAWSKMSQYDRVKWLQKKLVVIDFHDGVFQIVFFLDTTDAKDTDYIKKNADQLSDIIIGEFSKQINLLDTDSTLRIIDKTQMFPDVYFISKREIVFRYGILGGILGAVVGMIIVVINTLRKKND